MAYQKPPSDRIARFRRVNWSVKRDHTTSVPPNSSGAPTRPEKERSTLRTSIVVLILVNIVLGIVLLAPSAGRATIDAGPPRCCRGEGPNAYCCYGCCVRGPYCEKHSECREADGVR